LGKQTTGLKRRPNESIAKIITTLTKHSTRNKAKQLIKKNEKQKKQQNTKHHTSQNVHNQEKKQNTEELKNKKKHDLPISHTATTGRRGSYHLNTTCFYNSCTTKSSTDKNKKKDNKKDTQPNTTKTKKI